VIRRAGSRQRTVCKVYRPPAHVAQRSAIAAVVRTLSRLHFQLVGALNYALGPVYFAFAGRALPLDLSPDWRRLDLLQQNSIGEQSA